MPRPSSLLLALTAQETHDFLPDALLPDMLALADETQTVDPLSISAEAWTESLATFNPEVLVACWKTPRLPEVLPSRLRYVCYLAGSIRTLVSRAHLEQGLIVTNWGDSISRVVAEGAFMHVLAGMRGLAYWSVAMHQNGAWKDASTITRSLFERRIGIRGFGRIAREFVRLIAPFGCHISVLAPDLTETIAAAAGVAVCPSLNALFSDNDIVVELAPLNAATTGSIHESHLRLLRPGSLFVNVARGATVDEAALLRVAREGHIFIGLDVYSEEPLPRDSGFRGLPNVTLTPHLAGPTTDRRRDAGRRGLENLRAYTHDRPLNSPITPAVYDLST